MFLPLSIPPFLFFELWLDLLFELVQHMLVPHADGLHIAIAGDCFAAVGAGDLACAFVVAQCGEAFKIQLLLLGGAYNGQVEVQLRALNMVFGGVCVIGNRAFPPVLCLSDDGIQLCIDRSGLYLCNPGKFHDQSAKRPGKICIVSRMDSEHTMERSEVYLWNQRSDRQDRWRSANGQRRFLDLDAGCRRRSYRRGICAELPALAAVRRWER